VFASTGFTTSDRRLKSDFKPVDRGEAARLLALSIQTFKKHQNGQNKDAVMAVHIARLETEVTERKRLTELSATDLDWIAKTQREIDAWHAEDFLPMLGEAMPGRITGVMAQDVEAINADYVEKLPDGTLSLNDASILYQMIAALKDEIAELKRNK
jgi:hypothetical protein